MVFASSYSSANLFFFCTRFLLTGTLLPRHEITRLLLACRFYDDHTSFPDELGGAGITSPGRPV